MPTFGAPSASLATDFAMPRDFYIKLDCIVETFDQDGWRFTIAWRPLRPFYRFEVARFSLSPSL
jgi:hypothetical protein